MMIHLDVGTDWRCFGPQLGVAGICSLLHIHEPSGRDSASGPMIWTVAAAVDSTKKLLVKDELRLVVAFLSRDFR